MRQSKTILTEPEAWPGAQRVEAWAGELRVNRIRLVALIVFYVRHLVDMYMLHAGPPGAHSADPGVTARYHLGVTIIIILWGGMSAGLAWMLATRRVPPALKYVAVAWDLAMVTAIGVLAGEPRSPLMLLYFVVIASAPLRLSLKLIYVATFGAWIGYAIVLAWYAWYLVGFDRYYATPELRIPRSHEVIMLLSLGAAGLMAGQVVRQARRLVGGHAVSVDTSGGDVPREEA
jgi:nitrate/nitrite transporter NarK